MFLENLEELPETMRADFVEAELDGKKGFQHKSTVALANSLKNAKSEREGYRERLTASETKLGDFESQQEQKIEDAKVEALSKAKNSGDIEAITLQHDQQMADLKTRSFDEGKLQAATEYSEKQATLKSNGLADNIGLTLGVDTDSGEAIADLIRGRVIVDPATQKEVFYDAKGSALSVDKDGFIELLKTEKRYSRLIKAELSTLGGGNAKGGGFGGGASNNTNEAAEKAKKKGDGIGHLNAHFKNAF